MASKKNSAALAAGLLLAGSVAAEDLRRFEAAEPHMGTLFRITLYAPNERPAITAFRAAFNRVHELDRRLSDYNPDSELNRLCREAHRAPAPVSGDLFRVLDHAQQLARQSSGAFDVTLGPLIHLWREARREARLPTAAAIAEARRRAGYRKLHLDAARRTVRLDVPGMQLDLGAIAKGYAADEALKVLRERGLSHALIAAGGDIVAGDPPPGKQAWQVAVAGSPEIVPLVNAAISTSGDTEQFVEIGGVRYSHILDPRTGLGLNRRIAVSVQAPSGIEADSLATVLGVLGEPRAGRLLRHYPSARARFLTDHAAAGAGVSR